MIDKYIIKNCPALQQTYYCNTHHSKCQDCTDCTIKCIKSKLDYLKCYINNDNSANLDKMNEIIDGTSKLLDTQEAE